MYAFEKQPTSEKPSNSEIRAALATTLCDIDSTFSNLGISYAVLGSIGAFSVSGVEPSLFRGWERDGQTPKVVDIDYMIASQHRYPPREIKAVCDRLWEQSMSQSIPVEASPINLPRSVANDPNAVLDIIWAEGVLIVDGRPIILCGSPLSNTIITEIRQVYDVNFRTLPPLGQIACKVSFPGRSPLRYIRELANVRSLALHCHPQELQTLRTLPIPPSRKLELGFPR